MVWSSGVSVGHLSVAAPPEEVSKKRQPAPELVRGRSPRPECQGRTVPSQVFAMSACPAIVGWTPSRAQ